MRTGPRGVADPRRPADQSQRRPALRRPRRGDHRRRGPGERRAGRRQRIGADAVIEGVGLTPTTQLATAAGLDAGNGIRVDARLRTSRPDVHAAGDVADAVHPLLGRYIRVEHRSNALNQPQIAAKAMLCQCSGR
ncbi:FAD-dependent oxidoreductase [Streptomyces xiangluensis]|uniref:FAD-dependent oxidoreductase n=1 Tax=Streptomyces xiangluensis TaxID=2665720 RepID=A0ABV8YI52_9ACTN